MPENLTLKRAALHAEWQQKTIKDDPIFGTVMTNPNLCAELLRRALPELIIIGCQNGPHPLVLSL